MQAYLQRLLDSGDFPHLAGAGLDWLLTGFTTTLAGGG
jgi:hypothetical protein